MMQKSKARTVSEYIAKSPPERQKKLREMRALLKRAAPKAVEEIKWGTPVFSMSRILFAYAAFAGSINFMPTPSVMRQFKNDLAKYRIGKGSVMFSYDAPLPKVLITKMAKLRVKELKEKDSKWM